MDAEWFPTDAPAPGFEAQENGPFAALWLGARRVAQYWPALLLMQLGTLLSAGLLALVCALNLFELAHRPVIAEMAAGIHAWKLVDLFGMLSSTQPGGASSPASMDLFLLLLAFAAMPLVGGFVSAFLYGGVLLAYQEAQPGFRFGRFLWGCWHWFGAYLALGLLQALVFFGLCLPVSSLVIFLFGIGPAGIAVAAGGLLLLAWLWLMVFELARVRLVLNDTRNPFRGIGQGFGDLFRRPLPLLGFYAAALLLLLGVQAIFRLVINPNAPLDMLVVALVVQQGFILSRLFCRALRLAGLTVLLKK